MAADTTFEPDKINFVKINTGNLNSNITINSTITLTVIRNVPYSKFYCVGKKYTI